MSQTLYYHPSAAESSGNSADIDTSSINSIDIDITTTAQAGTSPTIQFFYDRKGLDSLYYPLWQSSIFSLAANTLSTSIGDGMAYNQVLGFKGRLRWVVGGSASPTYTFSAQIYGR